VAVHVSQPDMKSGIDYILMTHNVSISTGKPAEALGEKNLRMPTLLRPYWHLRIVLAFGISGAMAYSCDRALAQSKIVPDNTLGNENSVVVPNFNGLPVEVIEGGAQRGQNLFHSFQQFNVSKDRGAYFFSPNTDIQNILTRVTGNNPSVILGTLGTFGNSQPNLFLINPNGIIFGSNASLDVGGSFVATTANSIRLGNTGLFSASEPQSSNLLSINPSAFFFNSLASQAQIVNRSTATTTVLAAPTTGLQVGDGRSFLLVGGDVRLKGGRLFAPGGRVELGGVQENGTVGLNANGNELRLSFPTDVARADVSLTNEAEVNVRAGGGGSIAINARNVDVLQGSKVRAGIASGWGSPDSKAGDIEINATETMTVAGELSFLANAVLPEGVGKAGDINITTGSLFVKEGGYFNSATQGRGDAGSVTILARDTVSFDGTDPNGRTSGVVSIVAEGAVGNGGNVNITTGSLFVTNGAELVAGTAGKGNAGSIRIRASNTVRFDGGDAASSVDAGAVGNGGDIEINTGFLEVTNGASLLASTFGQGNAGSVRIRATDTVRFDGGDALGSVGAGAVGDGGDIEITSGSLSVSNGAFLSASTDGQGKAGTVRISATDTVRFDGGYAFSSVGAGGVGKGGDIEIITGSLSASNGAFLLASTFGKGNAGNVKLTATDTMHFNGGIVGSSVGAGAVANGGDIEITTGSLLVTNGAGLAGLSTGTSGQGNAGSIRIRASDTVRFDGGDAFSSVGLGGVGSAGDIEITTGSLSVSNGAGLAAQTAGKGNAGSVRITASDTVRFDGGNASSAVGLGGVGNGGDIEITTGSLEVTNGAFLIGSTIGQGNAGAVKINATDTVSFDRGGASSFVGPTGVGDGGVIEITTGSLSVTNGGLLVTSTFGQGNAGKIKITATDTVRFSGLGSNGQFSGAFSVVESEANGEGGEIEIASSELSLTDALISSVSLGTGRAGDITLQTRQNLETTRSSILASTQAGDGGDMRLQVGDLLLMRNNSKISTTAGIAGEGGNGGNITIDAGFIVAVPKEDSDITANAFNGRGGNINITTQGIYGLEYRERETPLSDITASSQFGVNGQFQLELLTNVDPSRGLTELPTDVVDASQQIDRRCTSAGTAGDRSSFTITGRGGLPASPNDMLQSESVITNWVSLDTDTGNNTPPPPIKKLSNSAPRQLVEAQGWIIDKKGQVVLTAQSPEVTPHSESLDPANCQVLQSTGTQKP
jgi:filamentous hemagglutinin family protein